MDYRKVRKAIEGSGQVQSVAVNHRTLITRTLTKYPVDFALFRELLQNGCDARANDIVISFESTVPGGLTKDKLFGLQSCLVDRLTIKNNGAYFSGDDWNRLKEIAKGNPDETKIGAFGVGFYSVFEHTDEPLVHSGETVMSFYFSGDQLCYRKETIEDSNSWTVIDLPYREPKPLPPLSKFIKFLTQSFVFISLQSIEVIVDNISIFCLKKKASPAVEHQISNGLSSVTLDIQMKLKSWSKESYRMTINHMLDVQNKSKKLLNSDPCSFTPVETLVTASFCKFTGKIDVTASPNFAKDLKATIMKVPPKEAVISMINDDKYESDNPSHLNPPFAEYIFPKEKEDAKIYIGFSTKQSSSICSHISMNQLIPTMERAAVDMANAFVKDWNSQLLYMAGGLSRLMYDQFLSHLQNSYPFPEYVETAVHFLKRFEFHVSTPDKDVGECIAKGFWNNSNALPIASQKGVFPCQQVWYAPDAEFIEKLPIIPQKIIDENKPFLDQAILFKSLKEISVLEVKKELTGRLLTPAKFSQLITWCIKQIKSQFLTSESFTTIMEVTNVAYEIGGEKKFVSMNKVNCFQDLYTLPKGFPLPPECLPVSLIPEISTADLKFLFKNSLSLSSWVSFAVEHSSTIPDDVNLLKSITFAETVLGQLSRFWKTFTKQEQADMISLLGRSSCIPTQMGLKLPSEAYFAPIDTFPQLPIKTANLTASKQFLSDLGLREYINIRFIFQLFQSPDSKMKWSTIHAVKYLCSLQKNLKAEDWKILRENPWLEGSNGKSYSAGELFAPNSALEKLDFICIKWESWYEASPEAQFLYSLGLKHHPDLLAILDLADDPDYGTGKAIPLKSKKADLALNYFLDNFQSNKYSPTTAFSSTSSCILCLQNGKKVKARPSNAFLNPQLEIFGFPVVHNDFSQHAFKFRIIAKVPPLAVLVDHLIANPPKSLQDANEKFAFLSYMPGTLDRSQKAKLETSCFIPFKKRSRNGLGTIVYLAPINVFLGGDSNMNARQKFYKIFFKFVNFSPQAKPFLELAGVKTNPGILDIIQVLLQNPFAMFQLSDSSQQYLGLLLEIYFSWSTVSQDSTLVEKMKQASFLMGEKYISTDEDEERGRIMTRKIQLAKASEIVIVDHGPYYNIFKEDIVTAPYDRSIERFYESLGCRKLSQAVKETTVIGKVQKAPDVVLDVKNMVVEKGFIYLENTRETISPKAFELLENLNVVAVNRIVIERQLTPLKGGKSSVFTTKKEEVTACVKFDSEKNLLSLMVVPRDLEWFDVSIDLIQYLLEKPSPDSGIVLEAMLKSSLKELQRKGYNTSRALRRLAKNEVDDREDLGKAERERLIAETMDKLEVEVDNLIPEDSVNGDSVTGKKSKGFFGKLFGSSKEAKKKPPKPPKAQKTKPAGETFPPPPHFTERKPINFTNLEKGITTSRKYSKKSMQLNTTSKNEADAIKLCDYSEIQKLKLSTTLKDGPSVYTTFTQSGNGPQVADTLSEDWLKEIQRFRFILHTISQKVIGNLAWDSVHIYLNETSNSIAFNCGGSLFFNVSFFVWNSMTAARKPGSQETNFRATKGNYEWDPIRQLDYWFTIFAHEIAHNLTRPHGATHSHYMEQYIQRYLPQLKKVSTDIESGVLVAPQ